MAVSLRVKNAGAYVTLGYDRYWIKQNDAYEIPKALWVKSAGSWIQVWQANGPPPAPTSLVATPANAGVLNVSWVLPTNDENDYSRTEVEQFSGIGRTNTTAPGTTQQRTGYTHGAVIGIQARTVDTAGLMSDWVSAAQATIINQAPAAPHTFTMSWNGTGFTAQWTSPTNPYSDITSVEVRRVSPSAAQVATQAWASGVRTATVASTAADTLQTFLVRAIGPGGSTDSGQVAIWSPPAPGTIKTITADLGDTWTQLSGWRNDGSVREGKYDDWPMGMNTGIYVYGSKLYDACHGYIPVKGEIFLIRNGSQGFSGNCHVMSHGYATKPAGAPVFVAPEWDTVFDFIGSGASAWEIMPAGAVQALAQGTTKGIGLYESQGFQSLYRHFHGPATNGAAGSIRFTF